ncbi:MAG: 23S rRNA (uracil(1939)-C(5))-methyltransferase RlmD [Clostridia bacterium]|nr:23S rRNA (uracil(1939)-C(5))-methyltransferase RlmD [Clostridia bacterium]
MKKNDLVEIKITSLTSDGSGIGRFNSMVIFIPNVAVGDVVIARILKVKKNYAYGKLEKILCESESRIENDCKTYLRCGGCCFRHISYEAESELKRQTVYDCLQRIAKFDESFLDEIMLPIVKAEKINNYRNKAQLPVRLAKDSEVLCGFFSLHSHRVVPLDECKLQPEIFDDIISVIKEWIKENKITVYDEVKKAGYIKHIYLRIGKVTNEIMVCIVVNSNKDKHSEELIKKLVSQFKDIKSIVYNFNSKDTNVILGEKCKTVFGKDYITDELCGLKFNISAHSFYQVNHDQTEKLYNIVKELVCTSGKERILDLFCGIGTIGLSLAKSCKEVLGIEIIKSAVDNAKENAKINKIDNARFVCSDANDIVSVLKKERFKPNVVIVDPPRKGCSADLIEDIVKINPDKIVYVSCNPSTLARDLKLFTEKDYVSKKVVPLDMFPRTVHVETVALLSRQKVQEHIYFDVNVQDIPKTARTTATYPEIKAYVKDKYGLNVTYLNIAQVKEKHGFEKRENYNKGKDGHKVPNCPQKKRKQSKMLLSTLECSKLVL